MLSCLLCVTGSGFQVASCSSQGQDEDCDLNVDDDDSEKYGKPQYPFSLNFYGDVRTSMPNCQDTAPLF